MASIINASSTGSGGLISTGDASGVLQLQSNGTVALSVSGATTTLSGNMVVNNQLSSAGDLILDAVFSTLIKKSGSTNVTINQFGLGLAGSNLSSGTGIAFPATQSASSDANTLDDYEEGTFTPTITGTSPAGTATYVNQIGKYTKIGDRVLINIYLQWSGGTGGGQMNISGLPFASDNQITLASYNANIAMTAGHVMQTITNSTLININSVPSGGGSDANVPYDASGLLIIGGSYKV
jgi:hypothetical protein